MGGSIGGSATQGEVLAAAAAKKVQANRLPDESSSMSYKPKQEPVVKRKGRKKTPTRDNLRLKT